VLMQRVVSSQQAIIWQGKTEVATCQWHVFSNDRSEAETGKEFRNGFDADFFCEIIYFLLDYDVT